MVTIHCKYFLVLIFQVIVSFNMFVSISSFLGMSRPETPSPAHSSKKGQKKCGLCHSFMSDLDPHPECNKYLVLAVRTVRALTVPPSTPRIRGRNGRAPAVRQKVFFDHEGTQGRISQGGEQS